MDVTKLRAMNGQVLVDPIKREEKRTAAGVIIPDVNSREARQRLDRATVVLADPETPLKEGEIVFYRPGSGMEIILDEKPYRVLGAHEIKLVAEN